MHQDFLAMRLPEGRFDGIFANASLFHVPKAQFTEKLVIGSHGVDIPPFEKLRDLKTWEEEKPPNDAMDFAQSELEGFVRT